LLLNKNILNLKFCSILGLLLAVHFHNQPISAVNDMTDEQKILVLQETIQLFSLENSYKKDENFVEDCAPLPPYTLSCALKLAHEKVMGTYDNRSTVMNTLRLIIYWNYFHRTGIHPIYSFGKHKNTTRQDIIKILNIAINNFKS
jgi:UDP-glucose 4-epimerase